VIWSDIGGFVAVAAMILVFAALLCFLVFRGGKR
jgi:hypothetical protein